MVPALQSVPTPLKLTVQAVSESPQRRVIEGRTTVALLFEEDVAELVAEGLPEFGPLQATSLQGGQPNKLLEVFPISEGGQSRMLVVGMGPRDKASKNTLQQAVHAAVQKMTDSKMSGADMFLPNVPKMQPDEVARVVADIAILSNHNWDMHKTDSDKKKARLTELSLLSSQTDDAHAQVVAAVKEQSVLSEGERAHNCR